ncbi:MAG: gluconate 2-dehydrogenase subunit 3 family protein [Cyclobacteriaceae bacterium]
MKRRKALLGISGITGGLLLSYVGYRWASLATKPDFSNLLGQKKLLEAITDVIIPKTDSPSASECLAHEFVIKMIMECSDTKTQNNFMTGLADLESYCNSEFKKSFINCSEEEKNQVIIYCAAKDKSAPGILGKIQKRIFGKSFFATLKEYTVIGYFTSQQGATTALRYALIPSKYMACLPYTSGEKGWATY